MTSKQCLNKVYGKLSTRMISLTMHDYYKPCGHIITSEHLMASSIVIVPDYVHMVGSNNMELISGKHMHQ
jgi:hypothetical protein